MKITNTVPLLLSLALFACTSPLEIDTPRDVAYRDSVVRSYVRGSKEPFVNTRVLAKRVTVRFYDLQPALVAYQSTWAFPTVIDTAGSSPAIWLEGTFEAPVGTESELPLRSLHLRLDSIRTGSGAYSVTGDPASGTGADFTTYMFTLQNHRAGVGGLPPVTATRAIDRLARRIVDQITLEANVGGRPLQMTGEITIEY